MKKFLFTLILFIVPASLCACGFSQNFPSSTDLSTDSQIDIPVPKFSTSKLQDTYLNTSSSLVGEDKLEFHPYSFHYIDSLYLHNVAFSIQIDVQSQKETAYLYQVKVSVSNSSGNPFCSFIDNFSTDDFNPETIDIGYLISDVNGDGNDDILIDLGGATPYRYFNCYVYDFNKMNFIKVNGFSSLPDPKIISDDEIVISYWKDGPVTYGADKYQIVGSDLQLLSRLIQSYAYDNGERPRYTEEKMIDGRITIIKENVLEDEIDDLSSYHLDD